MQGRTAGAVTDVEMGGRNVDEMLAKAYVVGDGARAGASRVLGDPGWTALYEQGWVVEPPYDLDILAGLYETNAVNKACVDAKAGSIAGLGYRLVRTDERGTEQGREAAIRLLEGRQTGTCFMDLIHGVCLDMESVGNGYIEVTRDSRGVIDGLYRVPATTVRVSPDRERLAQVVDGQRQWFHAYAYGTRVPTDGLTEILHFRKQSPASSHYGVPDIVAAIGAAAGDRAAKEYNLDFFEHNAVPRMAIIVEGGQLTDELMRQIQHFMESEIRGKGHKTLVLDVPGHDVKVRIEPLTVGNQDDAAFLAYRKANRDEIMMAHRVPPSKITVVENANLANSKDQDKTFREQVVRPEQRRIEQRINRMLAKDLGVPGWEFRFVEMDLDEEREQAEIARVYAEIGAWDVNEIRARQGLGPVKSVE